MNTVDLSKYEVKEIVQNKDKSYDEVVTYLLDILNDQFIPDNQKLVVRKQFDEIMRIKNITMKPPIIILSAKEQ